MGVIIKGQCPKCGYQTRNLYFGGGMLNFQYCCDYPVLNKTSKAIEIRNIMRKAIVLAEDPDILFYDDKNLSPNESGKAVHQITWGDYKLSVEGNYCPNCLSYNLEFNVRGHWD